MLPALGPADHAYAVTPHDTNALALPSHALFVGVGGDIALRAVGSSADTVWKNVPSGSWLPIQTSFVRATGTTATNIVAMRSRN